MFSLSECEKSANRCKSCFALRSGLPSVTSGFLTNLPWTSEAKDRISHLAAPCHVQQQMPGAQRCGFEMIRIERNRFNECRQRFRSMLVCKVLARIQDHLQNAEQALYRLRANSIVQICAVCIFTISIHLLILLAFPGIR